MISTALEPRDSPPDGPLILPTTLARGAGQIYLQAGSRQTTELYKYSPANVHAVFFIQTVNFCTRLVRALAKTSPVGGFFFFFFSCLVFRQSRFFGKIWTTFDQTFSAIPPPPLPEVGPPDGYMEQVR